MSPGRLPLGFRSSHGSAPFFPPAGLGGSQRKPSALPSGTHVLTYRAVMLGAVHPACVRYDAVEGGRAVALGGRGT